MAAKKDRALRPYPQRVMPIRGAGASIATVKQVSTEPTRLPQAFHLLAKPTGAVCSLDCAYSFFLSKEMLYPGSRFRMADELLVALHP